MYSGVKHELSRRLNFLLRNRDIELGARLRIASAMRPGRMAIRHLLTHRLMDGPEGLHFSVSGHSIHFQVGYDIKDRERLLAGIGQVIVETFIFPGLFSSEVFIREGDVVLDLGANVGTTALLFSSLVGSCGKVFAFEPVVHELCRANLERNGGRNVTLIPQGVSDSTGSVDFQLTDFCIDSSMVSAGQQVGVVGKRTCPVTRLDDWVAENQIDRVDFIKVDVEGAEENALRGALSLIEALRPRWSISSYHTDSKNEPQHPKLVALLKDLGYSVQEVGRQHIFAW